MRDGSHDRLMALFVADPQALDLPNLLTLAADEIERLRWLVEHARVAVDVLQDDLRRGGPDPR